MLKLKVDAIDYDPQYYPRVTGKSDWFTVNVYKDALLANPCKADPKQNPDVAFPPVVVVQKPGGRRYMLIDGLHRLEAFSAAKHDCIYAEVERLPQSKWLARSVELNVCGHRNLEVSDKAWVAVRLESEGWGIKKVAGLLHMQVESLEKIKVERTRLLSAKAAKRIPPGRGNRKVNGGNVGFLKSPFCSVASSSNVIEALSSQGPCSNRTALAAVDTVISVIRSNAMDLTDVEVMEGFVTLRDLLVGMELESLELVEA